MLYDVIIIGGGPAGLTAGIYTSRSKLKTLILDQGMPGGQLILTHEIANYPGAESLSGYMLASKMLQQAKSFGCEVKSNAKIKDLHLQGSIKKISLENGDVFESKSIIIATGGISREIGASNEKELKGRGVSYCATCDGDFFQDKNIIAVGGGNSALEEAVSLTKYASSVTIVHMLDNFQAFDYAVKEAKENPKINFVMESRITKFIGNERLEAVEIEHIPTGEKREQKIDGVFVFIGYVPNTKFLEGKVALNERGEIKVTRDLETNIEGVFAAGDSIEKKYRQVTIATGEGTIAALSAAEFVHRN
ncbi:MAG TPA: pyridine nucleotide-disulfide oxidoreductase [Bacteroidales bacterium]|nr:MAG: pyridine nucleotide-disulfide oxidoreductase [Bacteroidetes bacterium GWF2_33_38]OFY72172.1 MAG: pyridine nucleotide-disulfide oxidoreductase [Bacteroidetes bacterium RIFOXYA12_FULL_33_9]OFY92203.1 MAG: pyridine nucleotide-disulfide oxidoreductase [Bacteroidetes bacterium RIFOXYA2_FULL_33_7]HBF87016.1 pyridine nucleotide-disulfide oxidoreductase [Bacteroidales bacterium]